ncbi:MAG TPA: cob(I)yrinic acid a,c-diamide adenosyltransferase [Nevskiaceae bacterium]
MGNRVSRVTTRTGDAGTTGLADGERRPKTDARIAALGDVDELNCCIGLAVVEEIPDAVRAFLRRIQQELFDLGGELSLPGSEVISAAHVDALEQAVRSFNAGLPPLKEFVLPGGNRAAAAAHHARAVARRAERSAWALAAREPVNPELLRYLNRLSDALFVCARVLARRDGGEEVMWRHERHRGPWPGKR